MNAAMGCRVFRPRLPCGVMRCAMATARMGAFAMARDRMTEFSNMRRSRCGRNGYRNTALKNVMRY